MNARRKFRLRKKQWLARKLENRPLLAFCKRCGQPFSPDFMERIGMWARVCKPCQDMNLVEMLGVQHLFPSLVRRAKVVDLKPSNEVKV